MNIKITENLVPTGLGNHQTRSKVEKLPAGEKIPDGAVKTDEPVRDWQIDTEAPVAVEGTE